MKITSEELSSTALVYRIAGKINLECSTQLKQEIKEGYESGAKKVYLDFEHVDYMDTSGLGSLISILKQARKNEVELVIVKPSGFIKGLFRLTKMDRIFTIQEDLA
ncbi:MAG: STAS domain-containing protein [Candidatus Auribacterota bacterium]